MRNRKPKSDEAVTAVCLQREQAITAYTTGKPGLSVDAATFTWLQLGGFYQACIDTRTKLAAARAAVEAAMAARDAADAQREKVDEDVLRWAAATFGVDSPEAKAFGYEKPAHKPLTAEQKAAAVAKAKATKEARGETGTKKKTAPAPAPAQLDAAVATPAVASPAAGAPTKS